MKLLLDKFSNNEKNRVPVWLMRQAGRYLPEYMELRQQKPSFLDMCYDSNFAAEVTLQPIKRFGFDAAIIFSDILVIPHALGLDVTFEKNFGPKLKTITKTKDLENLSLENLIKNLTPVYRAIELTKGKLDQDKTLIGFVGAPWTIASYMVEGMGSKDFKNAKNMAYNNPKLFSKLIKLLIEAISAHALAQIEAGAEVIQIFDSWAGVLNQHNFTKWVIEPTVKIIENIRLKYPKVPIIGFPRKCGIYLKEYYLSTKVDGISIDSDYPLEHALTFLPENVVLQGNLDPVYLLSSDKNIIKREVTHILNVMKNKRFIFNLGHGILPTTPIENVSLMLEIIRNHG